MCPDPPEPDSNAVAYDWNKKTMSDYRTPFQTTVTYSCKTGAKFENGKVNETKAYTCQWNQTWTISNPEVRREFIHQLHITAQN